MVNTPQLAYDPIDVDIVVSAEATNVVTVTAQFKDSKGNDVTHRVAVIAYFSDDAYGDSILATQSSGAVAVATDGLIIPLLTGAAAAELNKKIFLMVSEADGDLAFTVTEAGAKTMYLILALPNGRLLASTALSFAA